MADGSHAPIGHNSPPVETPFEAVRVHVDDLMAEARVWLDGQPVTTQAEADGVSRLLDMIRQASKAADAARKEEAKPFDEGKAAVQARYKPLLESADRAADCCKKALAPFLQAQEAARQAAIREAQRVADAALEAARQPGLDAAFGTLEEREQADAAHKVAKAAQDAVKAVEKSRAHATGGARATTLRTSYEPVLTDGYEAAKWAWSVHRPEMEEFIVSLAKQRVAGGVRQIPGFEIQSRQVVV